MIIFNVEGGIGKSIAATAVVKAIKDDSKFAKEEVIVVSSYPQVFLNNPHIKKCIGHNEATYFYKEYMVGKDNIVMLHDPYKETDYIYERKHLIEVWCNMFGIEYRNQQPEIHLTKAEINHFQKSFVPPTDKPIFFIQANGGAENQALKYSWARDIPSYVVEEVVEKFKKDYNIYVIAREDQPKYRDTIHIQGTFRNIAALLPLSKKRLLMDSFLQHTAAAFKLPSVVCWIANKPEVLGYPLHQNIKANQFNATPDLRDSFLYPFDITGNPSQFPYEDEKDIFNASDIIKAVKAL